MLKGFDSPEELVVAAVLDALRAGVTATGADALVVLVILRNRIGNEILQETRSAIRRGRSEDE